MGTAIFGHYGDRIGRKATLIVTLLMTGIATAAVGLVPSYEMIGTWGAVILTLLSLSKGSGSAALLPDYTNRDISTEAHYEEPL